MSNDPPVTVTTGTVTTGTGGTNRPVIPSSNDRPQSGGTGDRVAGDPGITVSPTNGLITTKTGAKAEFTITLNSPPTAPVTIGLNVSPQNPAEGK